jgi:hypothetical protein
MYGLLWRVCVDANGKGYTMALSFGGPHLGKIYNEIKHKGKLGIKTLSKETHTVKSSTFGSYT